MLSCSKFTDRLSLSTQFLIQYTQWLSFAMLQHATMSPVSLAKTTVARATVQPLVARRPPGFMILSATRWPTSIRQIPVHHNTSVPLSSTEPQNSAGFLEKTVSISQLINISLFMSRTLSTSNTTTDSRLRSNCHAT